MNLFNTAERWPCWSSSHSQVTGFLLLILTLQLLLFSFWEGICPGQQSLDIHKHKTWCNQAIYMSEILESRVVAGFPLWWGLANWLHWTTATNTPQQELHTHHSRGNNCLAGNIPSKALPLLGSALRDTFCSDGNRIRQWDAFSKKPHELPGKETQHWVDIPHP